MKATTFYLLIEFLLAGVIVYFSIKLFLLYFFITWLWRRYKDTEDIMKYTGVQAMLLEIKILLMMKKLNVSKQDCVDIGTEYSEKNPEAWGKLYKDMQALGIKLVERTMMFD